MKEGCELAVLSLLVLEKYNNLEGGGLRRVLVKGYRCDTRSYECVLWFYAMQIKPKPHLFAQMVTK